MGIIIGKEFTKYDKDVESFKQMIGGEVDKRQNWVTGTVIEADVTTSFLWELENRILPLPGLCGKKLTIIWNKGTHPIRQTGGYRNFGTKLLCT